MLRQQLVLENVRDNGEEQRHPLKVDQVALKKTEECDVSVESTFRN
jgi:hypothetical protein